VAPKTVKILDILRVDVEKARLARIEERMVEEIV
jgi:hypothetical protein